MIKPHNNIIIELCPWCCSRVLIGLVALYTSTWHTSFLSWYLETFLAIGVIWIRSICTSCLSSLSSGSTTGILLPFTPWGYLFIIVVILILLFLEKVFKFLLLLQDHLQLFFKIVILTYPNFIWCWFKLMAQTKQFKVNLSHFGQSQTLEAIRYLTICTYHIFL